MKQRKSNEAKLELEYLERWKKIRNCLIKQLEQIVKLNPIKNDSITTRDKYIVEKIKIEMDDVEKYQEVIDSYSFYINRLESAMNEILSERQKMCCQLYAKFHEGKYNLSNEIDKLEISRPSFYRCLKESYVLLNQVLGESKFEIFGLIEEE